MEEKKYINIDNMATRLCQILKDARESMVIDENRADVAVKKDIANLDNIIPFAIVKDGHWYEKGQMGWWAVVLNEKDDHIWEEEVKKLLEGLSEDTIISIYDCHI